MKRTNKSFYGWDFLTNFEKVDLSCDDTPYEVSKPLAKNIKAAKNTVVYGAHSYHTKVPPEGIIPYIKHFTKPGDVVLDPFSGSGMTGVAGLLLDRESREEARKFILNDLGPAAIHISYNHNTYCDPVELRNAFNELLVSCEKKIRRLYRTWEPLDTSPAKVEILKLLSKADLKKAQKTKLLDGSVRLDLKIKNTNISLIEADVNSTIWSESYVCSGSFKGNVCGNELTVWDNGFDQVKGTAKAEITCTKCRTKHSRASFGRAIESVPVFVEIEFHDPSSGKIIRRKRPIFEFERSTILARKKSNIEQWYPTDAIAATREMMTMGPAKLGVKTVADFYTARNLEACAILWSEIAKISNERLRRVLAFAATNTFWHATRMRRFNAKGGSRPLTGTLYIPQISIECNVLEVYSKKIQMLEKYYNHVGKSSSKREVHFSLGSATDLPIKGSSVDYIFTDPPFGGNIFYSDCSVIWEAWLGAFTNEKQEMHFNRVRKPKDGGKTVGDYEKLMLDGYKEMFRVLKPGRWASIVFNNSDDRVLEMFRGTAEAAGFEIGEVAFFDKVQKSFKGYLGRDGKQRVTNCDIILNLRKPSLAVSPSKPKVREAISDNWIQRKIDEYLTALPKRLKVSGSAYSAEHRTLPFIHNALMKAVFSEDQSFGGFSLQRIEAILQKSFSEVEGLWYTPKQYKSLDRQLRLEVA